MFRIKKGLYKSGIYYRNSEIYFRAKHSNLALLSCSLVVMSSDLVFQVSKESSLLLGLDSSVICNPFLILEKLSIFNQSFMNICGAGSTSRSLNSDISMSSIMNIGVSALSSSNDFSAVRMGAFTVKVSFSMGVTFTVGQMSLTVSMGWVTNYHSLLNGLCNYGLVVCFRNNSLFKSFSNNDIGFSLSSIMGVLFVYDWHVLLIDESDMLFMDYWLMVLMDVLFNYYWLSMFMNNILMMFMDYVLVVLNVNIFVMLVDHVLMDFLNDGSSYVLNDFFCKFMSIYGPSFVFLLEHSFFLMGDHDWLLINLLNNSFSFMTVVVFSFMMTVLFSFMMM
jgi:hypothetical protein